MHTREREYLRPDACGTHINIHSVFFQSASLTMPRSIVFAPWQSARVWSVFNAITNTASSPHLSGNRVMHHAVRRHTRSRVRQFCGRMCVCVYMWAFWCSHANTITKHKHTRTKWEIFISNSFVRAANEHETSDNNNTRTPSVFSPLPLPVQHIRNGLSLNQTNKRWAREKAAERDRQRRVRVGARARGRMDTASAVVE